LPSRPATHPQSYRAPQVKPWWNAAAAAARIALLVYVVCTAVVVKLHWTGTGLDPSWAVGLNYLHNAGFRHGRDIAFTYGPLSFLTLPMDFGNNLLLGALFQTAAWVAFSVLVVWLVYARRLGLASLALFAFLFYLGIQTFHIFGYAGPDIFLAYLAALLLGGALEGRRWYLWYSAAVLAGVLLALIKWSSGLQALSAALAFPVALGVFDRRRALQAACAGILGAPLAFTAAYLLYNPSFADMIRYVRAGLELSAGHSAAQSSGGQNRDLIAALLIAGVYMGLLAGLYLTRQRSFVLGFALLPALFVEFKHSFIRYAGHVDIYFLFVPLTFGLVFLFTRFDRRSRWAVLALVPLLLAMRMRSEDHASWRHISGWPRGVANVKALRQVLHFDDTRSRLRTASAEALAADRLPAALLARLGDATVTAFPWEISYAAANRIRFVPFPIFSGFMAYTPYLDEWNASFFRDRTRAPQFILLEWMAIDGRNPLLDAPAMFTAMFQHYDFDSQYESRVLLKRRASARFTSLRLTHREEGRLGEPIRFRSFRAQPMIARVHVNYNLRGRALRFLFRIPEMRATHGGDSGAAAARISAEVAVDGVPLNFLPSNLAEAVELFRSGRVLQPADSLVISGPGASNFEPIIPVELYEYVEPVLTYPPSPVAPDLTQRRLRGAGEPSRIETLNYKGVTGIGPNEVIEVPDNSGYVQADGFAVDLLHNRLAESVWMRLDGRLYATTYGLDKAGVAALLGDSKYSRSGFSWVYPSWKLGTGTHTLSFVVVTADRTSYYEAPPLRFRVVRTASGGA
jgi:hypothetical protein